MGKTIPGPNSRIQTQLLLAVNTSSRFNPTFQHNRLHNSSRLSSNELSTDRHMVAFVILDNNKVNRYSSTSLRIRPPMPRTTIKSQPLVRMAFLSKKRSRFYTAKIQMFATYPEIFTTLALPSKETRLAWKPRQWSNFQHFTRSRR